MNIKKITNGTDGHISHDSTLTWEVSGPKDIIQSSIVNSDFRPWGIYFFIEDLRARKFYTYLTFDQELSFHVNSEDKEVNFWFYKNKEGYFNSIFVGLHSTNFEIAYKVGAKHVFSILSILSFLYKRAFRVWQIKVIDKVNDVNIEYVTRLSCPSLKKLNLPNFSMQQDNPFGSLFALYREGMNSVDIPYRFISFFKIYEVWYKNNYAKKFFHRGIEPPPILPKITLDFMGDSYRELFHKNFLNKKFKDKSVFYELNKLRNYLTHPFLDKNVPQPSYINFDDIDGNQYVEALSNLLEKMVTKILELEFQMYAKHNSAFEELIKSEKNS